MERGGIKDMGASRKRDRAGRPSDGAPSGLRDTATIPSAGASLQIWPFGHGVVCSAIGGTIGHGVMILTAVPDAQVTDNWQEGCPHDWETVLGWDVQRCVLTFPTPESVDRIIGELRDL